jgi:hypothetical protein
MKLHHLSDDAIGEALRAESAQLDAPEHVIQRAFTIWQPKATAKTESIVSKILAVIKFDSAQQSPMALGVRSIGYATRQIIFSADMRDIDLRIAAKNINQSAKAWAVSGQILGPDEGGSVTLAGTGREWTTSIDEMGEFHFDDLPDGDYRLSAHFEGAEVALPSFRIPAN